MIDLNEIRVFAQVVESRSFSAAAQILGQPRATVSRKVKQLESSLGVRLLQRTTRKLSLTDAGREYYVSCSSALSEIDLANQVLTSAQRNPSGVLRISAPLAAQTGFMCDWITEFLSLHEEVSIKLDLSDDVIDLIEDGVDVAFRAGSLKDSSLVARKLGNTKLVLCASPDYLIQSTALKSPKDLKNHTGIIFGNSLEKTSWRLQKGKDTVAVQVQGRVLVNSMEFTLQACLAGLGVALLPFAMIGELVKSRRLQMVLENYSANVGGLYVIYPSKRHLSTTVRAFVDFIITKADKGLPWERDIYPG